MVELSGVHLTLPGGSGPVHILKGVDLSVPAGQTVSVVGPSGGGKTTMLMLIAGLERPSRGLVRVAGQDLSRLDEDGLARFRRRRVGIVFQAFHLVPTMTAAENVSLPLELAGEPNASRAARQSLDQVGLADRAGHYPSQLSGGEQQRVAIARAFAAGPDLLLADEPTGNLDEETGARVIELLFSLRDEKGATLLLVTHDPNLARAAGNTYRMAAGRLSPTGQAKRED